MEIISVSCSCVRSKVFLMLQLCPKCPACAYLLGSTHLLLLLLAFPLRHITSVLPLKIRDVFNAYLLMPCIKVFAAFLSVHGAANADVSCQHAGVTSQAPGNTGCCSIKLLSTGARFSLCWKVSHPHSSHQCCAPHMHVIAGTEFKLC